MMLSDNTTVLVVYHWELLITFSQHHNVSTILIVPSVIVVIQSYHFIALFHQLAVSNYAFIYHTSKGSIQMVVANH